MDPQLLIGLGGVAGVITAIVAAYISLSKRKPEVARVFIESAGELVVTQSRVLKETTEAYEAIQKRMGFLERKSDAQEEAQRVSAAEIEHLHNELAKMHDEMAKLSKSRDQAREEADKSRQEINRLRTRIQLLEETLQENNLPMPDGPDKPYGTPDDRMIGYPTAKREPPTDTKN